MARGTLITIEGLDGAGKSTLAASLLEELRSRSAPAELVREPGGVDLSERIRTLVADPARDVSPRAEALLYAAARAQLTHELLAPRLEAGALLLLDRFSDSSLAYQGAGRELGIEPIRELNRFATGALLPDRTLLLRVSPAVGLARIRAAGAPPDRLEREPEEFFARVAHAYEQLALAEPLRIHTIDAEQPPAAVLADALAAIGPLLPASAADRSAG